MKIILKKKKSPFIFTNIMYACSTSQKIHLSFHSNKLYWSKLDRRFDINNYITFDAANSSISTRIHWRRNGWNHRAKNSIDNCHQQSFRLECLCHNADFFSQLHNDMDSNIDDFDQPLSTENDSSDSNGFEIKLREREGRGKIAALMVRSLRYRFLFNF